MKPNRKPCPECSTLMRRHDRRAGVQRWRCPACGMTTTDRVETTKGKHLGRGADPAKVAERVVLGMSEEAIAEALGMSAGGVRAQMEAIATAAMDRYERQRPGLGRGDWWALNAPHAYTVAVSSHRRSAWRVLDWVRPSDPIPLDQVVGHAPQPSAAPTEAVHWLARLTAPAADQDVAVLDERLWIAMARTNAWLAKPD
ncbi:transposase-like zinc-binding domain-containing protein [Burkholderia vietnamiensis]